MTYNLEDIVFCKRCDPLWGRVGVIVDVTEPRLRKSAIHYEAGRSRNVRFDGAFIPLSSERLEPQLNRDRSRCIGDFVLMPFVLFAGVTFCITLEFSMNET